MSFEKYELNFSFIFHTNEKHRVYAVKILRTAQKLKKSELLQQQNKIRKKLKIKCNFYNIFANLICYKILLMLVFSLQIFYSSRKL